MIRLDTKTRLCILVLPMFLYVNAAFAQATVEDRERLLRAQEVEEKRAAANAEAPGLAIDATLNQPRQDLNCFEIDNIDIQGVESLPIHQVTNLIEPYLHSCMGQNAVDNILQVLTQAYLDIGLITSRAYVPPQDLSSGLLQIVVVEGKIEDVVLARIVDGKISPGKPSRFKFAFPTGPGKILNLRDLEQGMDQINRVASAQGQLDIAPGQGIGGSVLNVAYADEDRFRLKFDLTHNTTDTGFSQSASLGFNADNLLGVNDTLYLGLSGGENSNTLSTIYSFPIGNLTVTARGNYSESLSQLTSTSELFEPNTSVSITGSWMLSRDSTRKTRLELRAGSSDNRRYVNGSQLTPQQIRTARLGVRHEEFGEGRYVAYDVGLTVGKLVSDTSGLTVGSGPQEKFGVLDFSLTHQKSLGSGSSLYTSLSGQYSSSPLFSPQQISIGGSGSLRGINGSSVSGDNGVILSSEYTLPADIFSVDSIGWLDGVSGFFFLDAGLIADREGSAQHAGVGLGAGAKVFVGKASFNFSVGFPVKTSGSISSNGPELSLQLSTKVF